MLFHGAPATLEDHPSTDIPATICKEGLKIPEDATNGTMFGHGIYLTPCASKADIYAKAECDRPQTATNPNSPRYRLRHMFLVRACLGCPCYATERHVHSHFAPLDRPDLGPTQQQKCTSLIARTHTCRPNPGAVRFPEVVLYKEALCVPMYLIKYRHKATCKCTHCKP